MHSLEIEGTSDQGPLAFDFLQSTEQKLPDAHRLQALFLFRRVLRLGEAFLSGLVVLLAPSADIGADPSVFARLCVVGGVVGVLSGYVQNVNIEPELPL
jgi:hypothetical protein